MTTVRVLHDYVGEYMAGDIVPDAPLGLVEIAEKELLNAATGLLLAEIVEQGLEDEFASLKQRAKELKIKGFGSMKYDTLKTGVEAAEADAKAAKLAEEEAAKKAAEEAAKNVANQ